MKSIKLVLVILLVFFISFFAIFTILPYFLSHHFLPQQLAKEAQIDLSLSIDKFSLSSIIINNIRLGTSQIPGLSIDSLKIHYTLQELNKKKISNITMSGLNCFIITDNNEIHISGINLPAKDGREDKTREQQKNPFEFLEKLPVHLNHLEIRNSFCTIKRKNKLYHLPFDLQISSLDDNMQSFKIVINILLSGEKVKLGGDIDIATNTFTLQLQTDSFPLHHPNSFLPPNLQAEFSTSTKIEASLFGNISPFSLEYTINTALKNFLFQQKTITLTNKTSPERVQNSTPVLIKVSGNMETTKAQISNLSLRSPIRMDLSQITINLDRQENTIKGDAHLESELHQKKDSDFRFNHPIMLSNNIKFHITNKKIQFTATLKQKELVDSSVTDPSIIFQNYAIKTASPKLTLTGTASATTANVNYKLSLSELLLKARKKEKSAPENMSAHVEELSWQGSLSYERKNDTPVLSSNFTLAGKKLTTNWQNQIKAQTDFAITGTISTEDSSQKKNLPKLTALLTLSDGQFTLSQHKLTGNGIKATLPLYWPLNQEGNKNGSFHIPQIKNPEYNLGNLTGDISTSKGSYEIIAQYSSEIIPNLKANLQALYILRQDSEQKKPTATLNLSVPKYHFNSAKLNISALADLAIDGYLEFNGNLQTSKTGVAGEYTAILSDTSVEDKKNTIKVSGVNLQIHVPDFTQIKSGPSTLSFKNINVGDLKIGEGKATFQVESPNTILIEQSSIAWSEGKVELFGTRIGTTREKDQEFMFYCNGINLATLLNQIGISNVSGKGKVNGKLPVTLKKEKIICNEGFLYSTPGIGGTIRLMNSDILLTAIPRNTVQFSQLDFASEALKNFNYKWVILNLNSQEDDALLAMKLAGKPAQTLPFNYDGKTGTFMRIKAQSKGIDSPIDLNVNIRLPLNKILSYGSNLQGMLDKLGVQIQ